MFCETCGRALPPDAPVCPACGAPTELAEYCGGFWGLTAGGERAPEQPKPDERLIAQRDALRGQIALRDRRERRLLGVILALAVMLILSAVMTLYLLLRPAPEEAAHREPTTQTEPRTLPGGFSDGSGANP